jgi:hypothetical protein
LSSNPRNQQASRTFYQTTRRHVPDDNTLQAYIEFYFLEISLGRSRTQACSIVFNRRTCSSIRMFIFI